MSLGFPKPRPRWLDRRQRLLDRARALRAAQATVRQRDGGRCRCCGAPGVHTHHVTFRSRGGTHDPANLLTLCQRCHSAVHGHALTISRQADGTLSFAWVPGAR